MRPLVLATAPLDPPTYADRNCRSTRAAQPTKVPPVPSFFRSPAAAYLLLPLASACWAGNHVSARAIAGHAPPASVSFVRWVVVFLVVSAIGWPQIKADLPKLWAKAGVMVFLSLTGGAAFGALQFVALQYTTALNMGVVGSVSPAFIVAASYLLFRDGLGPLQLFGVAVSLVGVLAIITQLYPERLLDLAFNGGDLIIIVNMVFWATYCACLRLRPTVHPLSFLFALAPISAIGTLPFAAWEYTAGYHLAADALTVSVVLYSAFFTSLLAFVAWNRGIDLIGAPRASAFLHTIPLFSAVFATTLLGEHLMLYHVVGFILILAGVTLAARSSRRPQTSVLVGDGGV
jgi:drug/metabolite transporter (DMT)-like permease